jgi:hypothetical protein
MELNRFRQLLKSTMGNVKPLIMEQTPPPGYKDITSWFTTPEGQKVTVNCTKGANGAKTNGSQNKSIPLKGEMYFMFC